MIYYTLISNILQLNDLQKSIVKLNEEYNTKIQYIIGQTEFETNDFYIGFNTTSNNLFLASDFKALVETNPLSEKEIVDLYHFIELIKNSHGFIPFAPPIIESNQLSFPANLGKTATPKNNTMNIELLINLRQIAQKMVDDLTLEIFKHQK